MTVAAAAGVRCPRCGNALDASLPQGLCARCALTFALEEPPAESAEESDAAALLPRRIGRYEVRGEIDRGGVGIVYRAWQADLKREVALKMLLPARLGTADALSRFRREAELMAGLDHPGILPVFEVGEHNGLPYFSMKLAEGGNLASRVAALRGRYQECARVVAIVARAIDYAHRRGVLHRDLKPSNVVFDAAGQCMVTDFGLARRLAADSSLTGVDALIGTPRYVAPEVVITAGARLTVAADVYGLGAIFYELLCGSAPFAELTPLQILQQVATRRPRPPRQIDGSIPAELEMLCLRCLEKRPRDRFASAAALADALEDWLRKPRSAVSRWRLLAGGLPSCRRRLIGVLAASVLGCVAAIAWIELEKPDPSVPDPAVATRTLAVIPGSAAKASPAELAAVKTLAARLQDTQPLSVLASESVLARVGSSGFPANEFERSVALGAFVNVIVAMRSAADGSAAVVIRVVDTLRHETIWASRVTADRLEAAAAEIAGVLAKRRATATPEAAIPRAALAEFLRGDREFVKYTSASNDNAVAAYRAASGLAPAWALPHVMLAQSYSERANRFADAAFWTDAALEEAQRSIGLDPALAGAYGVLGQAYYNKGWWQRSTQAYARGRALGGGRSAMGLSINYYLGGRFDESFAIFHEQLALDPDDFFFGYMGAHALFAVGATQEGERLMRRATASIPAEKQREADAEVALFTGDYSRCRELTSNLDPFLKSGGTFSTASVARACAVRAGDYAGALALLQPELDRNRDGKGDLLGNANPVLEQAILLILLHRQQDATPLLDSARNTAQSAIDGGNENWKNWLRVAAVQRVSGQMDDAYRSLDLAFDHGMTINARTDGDLEFEPFRDDDRFAGLRKTSLAKVASMRARIDAMLRDGT